MPETSRHTSTAPSDRLLPILIVWMTLVLGLVMFYLQTQTSFGGEREARATGPAPEASAGPVEAPPSETAPPTAPPATPETSKTPAPQSSMPPSLDVASLVGREGESDVTVANRSCAALAPLIPVVTGQTGITDATDPALARALDDIAAVGGVEGGGPETTTVRDAASALAAGAREALASQDPNAQQAAIERATKGLDTIKATCRRIA